MPNDKEILHRAPSPSSITPTVVILLAIILTVLLVGLGERAIYDLNRNLNQFYTPNITQEHPQYGDYKVTRLYFIMALAIPFLLAAVFLYLKLGLKKKGGFRILSIVYLIPAFWFLVHLLIEVCQYLFYKSVSLGIYVVGGVMAAVLTAVIIVIVKRALQKAEA